MVAVVELSNGPGTTAAYLRAALGLLPGARMLPGARRGATLPDVEVRQRGVRVDRSHLAAYDRVCGLRLTDTLPAAYPHVLTFPLAMRLMTAPGFPLPLVGLVHVTNRITVHRPIPSGAALDLSVRAADLRDHPRGRQFDMIATATIDGEEVWRGLSTYLRLAPSSSASGHTGRVGGSSGFEEGPSHQAGGSGEARPADSGSEPAPPAGSVWRVPVRVGGDYAAVSGDRNPIHTSRLGARLFGFPRPIAHGMWTKARVLAALEGRLPDAYRVEVIFKQPLLLPSTATFTATAAPDGWMFSVTSHRAHLTGTVTTALT
ncbi:MaoC/PaaZ C-terminal domain-containing protein [Actinoplanes sp. NEAU-A12]|uniref:MaoC/PaaZ C-terminal domain-containing protein n=1 Tax=Actinoplanes sandaracinus TaxID=3045177 RepID=A0ABT6WMK7_9ACTN|nr:MaoC/PaaZ C-terminal domain-containing protein [Actinoplanes sandaracinus]MDI6100973.1 MaoC/PaaZ C-terminal domain-containing protein [Actinoplanes sandaracinus]